MKVSFSTQGSLAEIYGKGQQVEYNLLDEKGEGVHPPFQCKDFFNDLFWSEKTGKPSSIYGFTWEPGKKSFSKNPYLMAIRYRGEDLSKLRGPLQDFLNKWEETISFKKSEVVTADDSKILVIKFHEDWVKQPIAISFFTLLIRISLSYDGSELKDFMKKYKDGKYRVYGSNDMSYVSRAWSRIESFLNKKEFKFKQTFEEYSSIPHLHNYSGICNYMGE